MTPLPFSPRGNENDATVRFSVATKGNPDAFAIVDASDAHLLEGFTWRAWRQKRTWYVRARFFDSQSQTWKQITLHRLLLGLTPDDPDVDHINGDGLDNRRANLRLCTGTQNNANRHRLPPHKSSNYRGVTWARRDHKWQAAIKANGRSHFLGYYESEVDAARAYDTACRTFFGEFGRPNFPHHIDPTP